MQDIYQTFEFNKIRECISEYSKTDLGRDHINSLTMLNSYEEVKESLSLLKEISSLLLRFGPLPISSSVNALKMIDIAKKTALLTARDLYLLSNDIDTINQINRYLAKVGDSYPLVNHIKEQFFDLSNLYNEIRRNITSSLTVADNATPELKQIRHNLKIKENELLNLTATLSVKYSDYLSDASDTIREGHFVLPVKTGFKGKVSGIIYDISQTGNTTFIEPLEMVELNNKITQLKLEENEEVRKILKGLTSLVLLQENEIIKNNILIAKLDFTVAKAHYGKQIDGIIADLSTDQVVSLIKARHPLIDSKKVVSNDYYIDDSRRIIIISGPNAGGKTVSLKTVGLITLMNQCGLMVPCLKATLGYFKHIYVDIGDNQSLSDNLSTFSAHMSQIGEISRLVKGKDLVLLDELGTGTDPKEGEALAVTIAKHLESKHCLCMISSHFDALKEYAFLSENVENSSMIFDEDKLMPTYIFSEGVPGKSYALDVAKRFGIDETLIAQAKHYLASDNKVDSASLITALQEKMEETVLLQEANKKKENELKALEKELKITKDNLQTRKDNLLNEVKAEKEEILDNAMEKVDEILKGLANPELKLHEAIEIKNKIEKLQEEENEIVFNENIKVGDYVRYPKLNIEGKVNKIKGEKVSITSNDGFTYELDKTILTIIDSPKEVHKPQQRDVDTHLKTNVGLELNIIGLRREEARDILIKYIDDCRLKRFKTVRIIHGFGSGILRSMVREYLDTQKDISYRSGDGYEGGSGATVVTFNERKN